MEEIWKSISGYENEYEVSNLGNVRSKTRYVGKGETGRTHYSRLKAKRVNQVGYEIVNLSKENKKKTFQVHNLVANAFLGESNGFVVNHIDENKTNNKLENLEYVTYQVNTLKSTALEKHLKTVRKPIIATNLVTKEETKFKSIYQASKNLKIKQSKISRVLKCGSGRGTSKQTHGFVFRYL
jgi:hypothetical protein